MNIYESDPVYHRAIWALDSKRDHRNTQLWLMVQRRGVSRMSAVDGIDTAIVRSEYDSFVDNCERILGQHETDRHRPDWQKQRDYLLGVVTRCLKAAKVKPPKSIPVGWKERFFNLFRRNVLAHRIDPVEAAYLVELCSVLHYYSPSGEEFTSDLGVGYFAWQGLRAELKQGITLALLSEDTHQTVRGIGDAMKNVIAALEHGDHTRLPRYEKSSLHLSEEQHRKQLWEGVVTELGWILRDNGKVMTAGLFS